MAPTFGCTRQLPVATFQLLENPRNRDVFGAKPIDFSVRERPIVGNGPLGDACRAQQRRTGRAIRTIADSLESTAGSVAEEAVPLKSPAKSAIR